MISVVVPVFNEEESLQQFYKTLVDSLSSLKEKYEVIFVDDGSTDSSLLVLKDLQKKDTTIRIFSLRTNHGKAEALTLGFQHAKGDTLVTLDADLQDRPEEIGRLYEELGKGYDVVSGWRKERKDSTKKILASRLFNKFVKVLWGLDLHDYNCGLKIYTSDAAKSLNLYGGMHRFIPLLAYQNGFNVSEIPVRHEPRAFGKSKYGFSKMWKDFPDMFTMLFLARYHKRPLHFFSIIGGLFALIGVLFITYLTILHYLYGQAVGRRPLLFMGILFILSGLQVFFTGFLAELIINISHKEYHHPPLRYVSDDERSRA